MSPDLANSLAWFGLLVTLFAIALSIIGLITALKSAAVLVRLEKAVETLQSGALNQLLEQQQLLMGSAAGIRRPGVTPSEQAPPLPPFEDGAGSHSSQS